MGEKKTEISEKLDFKPTQAVLTLCHGEKPLTCCHEFSVCHLACMLFTAFSTVCSSTVPFCEAVSF